MEQTRRRFLALTAGTSATATAGCLSDDDDDPSNTTDTTEQDTQPDSTENQDQPDDGDEDEAEDEAEEPEDLVADFTVEPAEPLFINPVVFTEQTHQEDAENLDYQWDFSDDGETDETGTEVEWEFDAPGEYDVTLTVVDETEQTDEVTKTVTVGHPPTAEDIFGNRTIEVVEMVQWHAEEHPRLLEEYRSEVSETTTLIDEIVEQDEITTEDVNTVEEAVDELEEYIESFSPYYRTPRQVLTARPKIEEAHRFASVGDTDNAGQELDDVQSRIQLLPNDVREITADPLQGTPLEILGGGDPPSGTILSLHRPHNDEELALRDRAYTEEDYNDLNSPVIVREPEKTITGATSDPAHNFADQVSPISIDRNRKDTIQMVVSDLPEPQGGGQGEMTIRTDELQSYPIYIQQYEDTQAAEDAFESLFDAEATPITPRSVDLNGSPIEWEHAAYQSPSGDTLYGLFKQKGQFLLTTGLSNNPVDRRQENWDEILTQTWIAVPEPDWQSE